MQLLAAIQAKRGLNAADLATLCEVHERTVYRDLDTLNASGVPCGFDPETGGYRVTPGFFMPPVELTFEEAMAIVALLEQVGDGAQIPFLGAAARAAEKLRSQLPADLIDSVEPTDGRIHIDLARSAGDDSCRDVYDDIRDAIARRRIVLCTYESVNPHPEHDTPATFELRPYALWFCQRAWYVVGHHGGRGAVRRLKLNRFTSLRVTDRPFAIPDDFDLREDLGLAWRMIRGEQRYRIAVRFEPAFADAASETRWHPTQQEEWHDDGRVTLRFEVDGLGEILYWVMGYADGATVLEPPELAEKVRDLAAATVKRYG
ncbi:MAG: WYL domain-containing protein [Tepidisphaeraceae bacterium]